MNIFEYAARAERAWEMQMQELSGYERKTTFYSDLSIADCFGIDAVKDTYRRVLKEWITILSTSQSLRCALIIRVGNTHHTKEIHISNLASCMPNCGTRFPTKSTNITRTTKRLLITSFK